MRKYTGALAAELPGGGGNDDHNTTLPMGLSPIAHEKKKKNWSLADFQGGVILTECALNICASS